MSGFPRTIRVCGTVTGLALILALPAGRTAAAQAPATGQNASPKPVSTSTSTTGTTSSPSPQAAPSAQPNPASSAALNIVVLDPAHGGVDLGARGTEGIRESEVILQFAAQTKQALETQGFQVILTRQGNDNPSFDERSARVNSQRGAVFITLHIASMGLAGTVHTYVMPDATSGFQATGLIPWEKAQMPFLSLSHKLGDLVQAELAKRFRGSPPAAEVAPVRQLRTTAAPAIAIEISSVSVQSREELDRMVPGVAEAIAQGVAAFRPSYVLSALPGPTSGGQP